VLVYIIFLSLYKSTCFKLLSAPEAFYFSSLYIYNPSLSIAAMDNTIL